MFPYKEDLVRFDFEIAPEDEYMWHFLPVKGLNGANGVNGHEAQWDVLDIDVNP